MHDVSSANAALRAFRDFLSQIAAEVRDMRKMQVPAANRAVGIASENFANGAEERRHRARFISGLGGIFFGCLRCGIISVVHALSSAASRSRLEFLSEDGPGF